MIEFDAVSFWYPDADEPVLDGVDLAVPEGELSLVIGASGSGTSTLLRAGRIGHGRRSIHGRVPAA
jgi:energy-coupling factor transport system ATP-binding protein